MSVEPLDSQVALRCCCAVSRLSGFLFWLLSTNELKPCRPLRLPLIGLYNVSTRIGNLISPQCLSGLYNVSTCMETYSNFPTKTLNHLVQPESMDDQMIELEAEVEVQLPCSCPRAAPRSCQRAGVGCQVLREENESLEAQLKSAAVDYGRLQTQLLSKDSELQLCSSTARSAAQQTMARKNAQSSTSQRECEERCGK